MLLHYELEEVLRISPEVKAIIDRGITGEVTALLTMESHEKTIFCYQQNGDLVIRDVQQRAVSFHDHRVVSIDTELGNTKKKILSRGLEALATLAMEDIAALRMKQAELKEKREYLKGVKRILGGKNHILEMFASPEPGQREEYRKAEIKTQ